MYRLWYKHTRLGITILHHTGAKQWCGGGTSFGIFLFSLTLSCPDISGDVPFQRRALVCPHSGAVQRPSPRRSYPRRRFSDGEQMNSTLLALETPADTEHKWTIMCQTWQRCVCLYLGEWRNEEVFHVTFLISSGMALERFVLKSSWNHVHKCNKSSSRLSLNIYAHPVSLRKVYRNRVCAIRERDVLTVSSAPEMLRWKRPSWWAAASMGLKTWSGVKHKLWFYRKRFQRQTQTLNCPAANVCSVATVWLLTYWTSSGFAVKCSQFMSDFLTSRISKIQSFYII